MITDYEFIIFFNTTIALQSSETENNL